MRWQGTKSSAHSTLQVLVWGFVHPDKAFFLIHTKKAQEQPVMWTCCTGSLASLACQGAATVPPAPSPSPPHPFCHHWPCSAAGRRDGADRRKTCIKLDSSSGPSPGIGYSCDSKPSQAASESAQRHLKPDSWGRVWIKDDPEHWLQVIGWQLTGSELPPSLSLLFPQSPEPEPVLTTPPPLLNTLVWESSVSSLVK